MGGFPLHSRTTQLVKTLDLHSNDCRFESHCRRGIFLVWASLSLQTASVASEYRDKNNGGPNQWIPRVKKTPQFSQIRLSLLVKSGLILIR